MVATASRARRKILSAQISIRKTRLTKWSRAAGAAASAAEVGASPTSSLNQYAGVDPEDLDKCPVKRESSSRWKRPLLNVWNLHDTSLSLWIVRIFYHRDVKIFISFAEGDVGGAVARGDIEDV